MICWDAVIGNSSDLFPVVSSWHHEDKWLQLVSLKIFFVLSKKIKKNPPEVKQYLQLQLMFSNSFI